ncbi:MAG: phosphotransferase, partial [Sphaerospermopsis sp. SIO1G2]|nr:phosphotransferase [Sphaerospermopsis sp. SIO1G2]
MKPEEFKKIIGYFVTESQEHLDTLYKGISNLQNTINNQDELNIMFRATFSMKGGAAMLGFTKMQKIVSDLEDCLKLLYYPIIADQSLQKLFLDIFNVINTLVSEIKTPEGLTETKVNQIVGDVDHIHNILNSHLLFLISKSNYKTKINKINKSQDWDYNIPLKLILLDSKVFLCRTFADYFEGLPNVEIIHGTFDQLPFFDCIITGASSVKSANDKIDTRILNFFGQDVEELVQKRIQEEYLSEQP